VGVSPRGICFFDLFSSLQDGSATHKSKRSVASIAATEAMKLIVGARD